MPDSVLVEARRSMFDSICLRKEVLHGIVVSNEASLLGVDDCAATFCLIVGSPAFIPTFSPYRCSPVTRPTDNTVSLVELLCA